MSVTARLHHWRDWFPVPDENFRVDLVRWILLDANRLAVTGALLTVVFVTYMGVATVWTFEMQRLLTETSTVQSLLDTFLSGIILLVSIVVSINSIVLSHDIASIENQEDRIRAIVRFREDLSEVSESDENPSNPSAFLSAMSRLIDERAKALTTGLDDVEQSFAEEIEEYAASVSNAAVQLGDIDGTSGAEFSILWKGIDFDYGSYIDQSRDLNGADATAEAFDDLIEAFELFAVGKEYFKTLYYTQEVSKLSQTLLVVALPAILFNASTILAINQEIFPDFQILGIPTLQVFVAVSFTISMAPYLVLTSYMLRLSTVAQGTASGGIFSLK